MIVLFDYLEDGNVLVKSKATVFFLTSSLLIRGEVYLT